MNKDNLNRLADAVAASDSFDPTVCRNQAGQPCSLDAIAATLAHGAVPQTCATARELAMQWLGLTPGQADAMFATSTQPGMRNRPVKAQAVAMLKHAAKTDAVLWPTPRRRAA